MSTMTTSSDPACATVPTHRRLHVGGRIVAPGWEIMDANPGPHVDHVGDARDLSRFQDATFEAVYASHVLEHFGYLTELCAALQEWHRVLKPGGVLYVSVPDLDTLCALLIDRKNLTLSERFAVMRMMFGGQSSAWDFHKTGLNEDFLKDFLKRTGFVDVRRVRSLGMFEDTSIMSFKDKPISLNVIAHKPGSEPQPPDR
jgi:predicted SAM-dependent methyltransferase